MKLQQLFEHKYWYHVPTGDFEMFGPREQHSDFLEFEPERFGVDLSKADMESDRLFDDLFDMAHKNGWVRIDYGYEIGGNGSFVTAENKRDIRKTLKWMIDQDDIDALNWPLHIQWEERGKYISIPIKNEFVMHEFIKKGRV